MEGICPYCGGPNWNDDPANDAPCQDGGCCWCDSDNGHIPHECTNPYEPPASPGGHPLGRYDPDREKPGGCYCHTLPPQMPSVTVCGVCAGKAVSETPESPKVPWRGKLRRKR